MGKKVTVPIVFVDTYGSKNQQPKLNVGIEDAKGAYELTTYLLNKNHRKIIFLAKGEDSEKWVGADFERAKGVKAAMKNGSYLHCLWGCQQLIKIINHLFMRY